MLAMFTNYKVASLALITFLSKFKYVLLTRLHLLPIFSYVLVLSWIKYNNSPTFYDGQIIS